MKKIKILIVGFIVSIVVIMGITVIVDPLYVYHGPILGMNEVLFESALQVEGTIRHFDYSSALVGSSMIENADTTILDKDFNTKTLKIAKESGSMADLLLYLSEAHKYQSLDYVFMGIDLSALVADVEPTIPSGYSPEYLFTNSILDDAKYLLNKDILLKKIPLFFAYEKSGKYCGEKTYYFAEGKDFSKEGALANYDRPEAVGDVLPVEKEKIKTNVDNLVYEIKQHPDSTYILFYQPYSELWWDNCYREGEYENYFYALEYSLDELASLENAKVFYFMAEEEIVMNLELYMDISHFTPDINQWILKSISKENNFLVKKSEVTNLTNKTRAMFDKIIQDTPWL